MQYSTQIQNEIRFVVAIPKILRSKFFRHPFLKQISNAGFSHILNINRGRQLFKARTQIKQWNDYKENTC